VAPLPAWTVAASTWLGFGCVLVASAAGSDQYKDLMNGTLATGAANHEFEGRDAAEDWILIGLPYPGVCQIAFSIEGMQPFVNLDEIADPQHSVLCEELRGWVEFELLDRRSVFERKQSQQLFVGQLPTRCDFQKCFQAYGAKPQALTLKAEIGHHLPPLAFLCIVHGFPFDLSIQAPGKSTPDCGARGPVHHQITHNREHYQAFQCGEQMP
jgi:hypothetical protein